MQNVKTFIRMFRQLYEILSKEERRKAVIVAIMSFFSAILETMGVGVILPFVLALLQPNSLMSFSKLVWILGIFEIHTEKGMVLLVGIGVIVIYALKNFFILFYNGYRLSFRNHLEKDLSVLMLESYINKPYSFFLNINSGEIIRGVTNDNAAVVSVLDGYCGLLNELLTCIMIGIALVIINPLMAFTVLILAGIISLMTILILKKRIAGYALKTREAFADRLKCVNESINGIKDIAVMKRQKLFLTRFSNSSLVACENNTRYLWTSMLPSRVIEFIFLSGLVVIILCIYKENSDMSIIAAQFSALAVAAIRILPAISNISGSVNLLVYSRPAFESTYENIIVYEKQSYPEDSLNQDQKREKIVFRDCIELKNISWKYSDCLPEVLHDINLTIKRGESVGIIGESGSGKTTLADIILGILHPQKGSVAVDSKDIFDKNTCWNQMVGYVPQNVFLLDDSIKHNILFGINDADMDVEKFNNAIEGAQLKQFINSQIDGIDTILGERGIRISGGQKQRIAIARALYYDPDILVLDEATSALDNETEDAVIAAINTLHGKKTLVIIAHRLTTIEKCDKVYEIVEGKLLIRRTK